MLNIYVKLIMGHDSSPDSPRLLTTVRGGEEFIYVAQRCVGRQVAGGHEYESPEGVGNGGNAFGDRLADLLGISAEYSVDHIHIARCDEPAAVKLINLTDRDYGINGNAVSSGFGIEGKLGPDISALVEEAPK